MGDDRVIATAGWVMARDAAYARLRTFTDARVRQHAEDLAQEVAIKYAAAAAAAEEPIANPAAWANVAAGRLAINLIHSLDRGPLDAAALEAHDNLAQSIAKGLGTSQPAIARQQADLLLAQLNDRERELFQLLADGYDNTEIAEIMGYAGADTVKSIVSRKRKQLIAVLERHGVEPDWQNHPHAY